MLPIVSLAAKVRLLRLGVANQETESPARPHSGGRVDQAIYALTPDLLRFQTELD